MKSSSYQLGTIGMAFGLWIMFSHRFVLFVQLELFARCMFCRLIFLLVKWLFRLMVDAGGIRMLLFVESASPFLPNFFLLYRMEISQKSRKKNRSSLFFAFL